MIISMTNLSLPVVCLEQGSMATVFEPRVEKSTGDNWPISMSTESGTSGLLSTSGCAQTCRRALQLKFV